MSATHKILLLVTLLSVLAVSLAAESNGLKFLQSLAVPGLSQIRSGRGYGYGMLASELGIIGTMLYLGEEENLKTQEYYEYAVKYAHIRPGDYPSQYFQDLSRYDCSGFEAGGYNEEIRQQAMSRYPNDPVQQQIYIDENIYPDNYSWSWDSGTHRGKYSKIRIHTQDLRDYGKIAVGVLIVNHLISGIDVLRVISETRRAQVYMDIKDNSPMLMLNLEW